MIQRCNYTVIILSLIILLGLPDLERLLSRVHSNSLFKQGDVMNHSNEYSVIRLGYVLRWR
jgi:hypothetical protein